MKTSRLLPMVLLGALAARGATLVEASVEELTASSVAVARVRITGTQVLRADPRHLVTLADCEVLEVFKGRLEGTLTVTTPGGELGDVAQRVAGAPRFSVGEEAVLFLRSPLGGAWQVTGLEQGKWTVDPKARTAVVAHTVPRVDRAGQPLSYSPRGVLSLSELKGRVQAR